MSFGLYEQDSFEKAIPHPDSGSILNSLASTILQCFSYTMRLPALFQHKIFVGIRRKDTDDIKLLIQDLF